MSIASLYPDHVRTLQAGVEAILAEHQLDALVICSGAPTQKNRFDDMYWPLVPTPAFLHWVPLVEPDAYIVVRPGKRPTLVRTVVDDFWEQLPPPESTHFLSEVEVVEVKPDHAGDALPGGRVAIITRDPAKAPPGNVNPAPVIAALDALRTRKTPYEIACLAEANRRAVRGHRRTAELFAAGTPSELELHLAYLGATEQDDAAAPYQGIVALGAHAAILHYVAYKSERVAGDTSLLVDAGARCLGYPADITRTYVRGASPAARRFGDLLDATDRLQREIIQRVRPGMPYEDLHDDAHRLIAAALRELGIARGSVDELVERGITRAVLPHGLGHSLGLCVHDVGMKLTPPRPENRFLRNTSVIEVGQVFTIEPGIYVIDGLLGPLQRDDRRELLDWAAIADLRAFGGVRIEDNVVVEAAGPRNLTREAFQSAS